MPQIEPPYPAKQLAFHQLLVAARTTVLRKAVADALGMADPNVVAAELAHYAPAAARKVLARVGIRDEQVFATPQVLTLRPTTLGYYRLLLGVSQKAFYATETGLSRFKSMEVKNVLRPKIAPELPQLCKALNEQMAELITQLSPEVTRTDVDQLPLLTLGVQFDGGWRNDIGKQATQDVFLAIREVVEVHIVGETDNTIRVKNQSGRLVKIVLASDPDVAITEEFPGGPPQLNVALEIKGGTDRSNAHNRAGEAEKSHQKVKAQARDFWTLIATKGVRKAQLAVESPTTKRWFDVAEVLARDGADWEKFRNSIHGAIGI